MNVKYELIELDEKFEFNGKFNKIKLLLIANPNAPTGLSLSDDLMLKLVKNKKSILLIDEAYADFSKIILCILPLSMRIA